MEKYKYIIALLLFAFSFNACEDVLDRKPLDIISSSVVWNDAQLVEAYLADLHNSLPFLHFGHQVNVNPDNFWDLPMLETLTDQAGATRFNREPARKKLGNTTQTGGLIEMWLYGQIRKMNEFYKEMEKSSLVQEKKNLFTGTVKFLEAFSYFEMAKRYGAVPIIRKAQQITDPYEELYPHRNPEVEVYNYAIGLLDEIINADLLKPVEGLGYPTKGAALALKSRIALYAASIARFSTMQLDGLLGVPKSDENKFWQMAYDASDSVITSGTYSLYSKYPDDLSTRFYKMSVDKVNTERIYIKNYDGLNIGHHYDFTMSPVGFVSPQYACHSTAPYLDFVESFEKIDGSSSIIPREWATTVKQVTLNEIFGGYDPRMDGAILREGSTFMGKTVGFYEGLRLPNGNLLNGENAMYEGVFAWGDSRKVIAAQRLNTGFCVRKYLDEGYPSPAQRDMSSTDKIILRLGEMYLNRAEAAYYLNKGDKGLADINTIRQRAGMPLRASITEENIRYERMAELCFEDGARYWDLIRWRKAVGNISKQFSGLQLIKVFGTDKYEVRFHKYTGDGTPFKSLFKNAHYYKPITPNRIANNPNLGPENPGY